MPRAVRKNRKSPAPQSKNTKDNSLQKPYKIRAALLIKCSKDSSQ